TRTGDLAAVMRGLDRCEDVGLRHHKVNCVTMRGTNDDEFADFARLTLGRALTVRFIEYMPLGDAALLRSVGGSMMSPPEDKKHGLVAGGTIDESEIGPAGGCTAQDRGQDAFISETEVRERIEAELGPLLEVDRATEAGAGPAVPYRLAHCNALGRIGFISAMSALFCATCNRLRLT